MCASFSPNLTGQRGEAWDWLRLRLSKPLQRLGLPIYQPEKIKQNEELRGEVRARLRRRRSSLSATGELFPSGCLIFRSTETSICTRRLLPKYRGAAPIQWAIANGEQVTGVTTMRIDEGLDTGDILLQKELAILDEDTAETLSPRLAAIGAELMIETLRGLAEGTISPRPAKR